MKEDTQLIPRSYIQEVKHYLHLGNFVAALASCDQAINIDPNLAGAHAYKGFALLQLNRPEDALTSFEQAITIDRNLAQAHVGKGDVLRQLHRPEDALTSYQQAIDINPELAGAHAAKAITLQQLNRLEEARASDAEARRLAPAPVSKEASYNTRLFQKETWRWCKEGFFFPAQSVSDAGTIASELRRARLPVDIKQKACAVIVIGSFDRGLKLLAHAYGEREFREPQPQNTDLTVFQEATYSKPKWCRYTNRSFVPTALLSQTNNNKTARLVDETVGSLQLLTIQDNEQKKGGKRPLAPHNIVNDVTDHRAPKQQRDR